MPGGEAEFTTRIRALDPGDACGKFKLHRIDDALGGFLRNLSKPFEASNIAKTYVHVEVTDQGERIRSYISILLSEFRKEYANLEDCPEASRYNFPAVKIARLATDVRYEGRGLGASLIDFVAGLARSQIMPHVGCRFLTLDANRAKIDFYKRRGFVLVENAENLAEENQNPVMFMDLHKVAEAGG